MSIPAAYLTVILVWSTTPLAIKWSAEGAGFAFAVAARMGIGLVVSAVILALLYGRLPLHRRARLSYLVGGLGLFGAMTSSYWGARYIHSGLISVIFGLSPLVTGVFAVLWLKEAALTPAKVAGMLLALLGLWVISGDRHELGGAHALAGGAAILAAVCMQAASLVWLKRIGDDSPPLATNTGTLLVALPLFVLVWWLVEGRLPASMPPRAALSIVYLGVAGSVLGFVAYYYVIRHMEAGKVALITLITPVLALMLGHALNGEVAGGRVWLGAALIALGLAVHHGPALAGVLAPRSSRLG